MIINLPLIIICFIIYTIIIIIFTKLFVYNSIKNMFYIEKCRKCNMVKIAANYTDIVREWETFRWEFIARFIQTFPNILFNTKNMVENLNIVFNKIEELE